MRPRDIPRSEISQGYLKLSLCPLSTQGCRGNLQRLHKTSTSDKTKAELYSKLCLLDELVVTKYMPLRQAFEDYIGMIPAMYHPDMHNISLAQQTFVDSILNKDRGLPVVIAKPDGNKQYIVLFECVGCEETSPYLATLGKLLSTVSFQHPLEKLAGYFKGLLKLLNSPREVAVMHCTLSIMFSRTELRHHLGLNEDKSAALHTSILQYVALMDEKENDAKGYAEKQYQALISRILNSLNNDHRSFEENNDRLHQREKVIQQDKLENKIKCRKQLK